MAAHTVSIRLSYLLCPDRTAAMKLVWLALQVDKHLDHKKLRSPSRIQRRIGLSRRTIRTALRLLKEAFRPQVPNDLRGLRNLHVDVKADLITDKAVPALARVLYCILVGLTEMKRFDVLSSYKNIAKVVHLQPRTVRLAIKALISAGWLSIEQDNQRRPITFTFSDPKATRRRAERRRAEQRLEKSLYHGETLALLWCDTLVDSANYQDDHFPQSFTNPLTNELLQADRFYFYRNGVAIEFNGPQHDGPTPRFSKEEAQAQMARDRLKNDICKRQNIPLVAVRPEDLSYHRMRQLLGSVLPLRDVSPDEPVVEYLEYRSRRYRKSIQRIRTQSATILKRRRSSKPKARESPPYRRNAI